jgi:hypothetical protein
MMGLGILFWANLDGGDGELSAERGVRFSLQRMQRAVAPYRKALRAEALAETDNYPDSDRKRKTGRPVAAS